MQNSVHKTKQLPNDTYIAIINIIVNSQYLSNSSFGYHIHLVIFNLASWTAIVFIEW